MGEQQVTGERWGDPISEERQEELRALFERQKEWVAQPEAARGESVFNDVHLTGADVFWLAEASGRGEDGSVPNLHLEGADLGGAHLAHAQLSFAQLAGARFYHTHLEGADLGGAQLVMASLGGAHLARTQLSFAQLDGAYLLKAQLVGAHLTAAQLKEAYLVEAQLAGANLSGAQLAGANLSEAQLAGANLTDATFDKTTHLNEAVLTSASLDQVTYDGVNLTVVDWTVVPVLGDELTARQRKDKDGKPKSHKHRLDEFTAAVRANRVLAVTLRSQGMNEDADRYAYRAQLLQRTVLRLRRRWGAAFGSWLLDLVSGYGYKPVRSLITYVTTIAVFAALYWCVTNDISLTHGLFTQALLWLHMTPPTATPPPLQPYEAVVVSMTSFHGRGFFQPVQSPGDKVAILAAIEAAGGLLIEIVFIATFTQRFFAR